MKKLTGLHKVIPLIALFLFYFMFPALAETTTIYSSADTWSDSKYGPDINRNNQPTLELAYTSSPAESFYSYPYLKFDLSSIPSGSTIHEADLNLTLKSTFSSSDAPVVIRRCTEPWDETTLTWNNSPSVNAFPSAEGTLGRIPLAKTHIDMCGLVQSWVNGDIPNNGFKMNFPKVYGRGTFLEVNWIFYSSIVPESVRRPQLVVTYSPPPASTAPQAGESAAAESSTTGEAAGISISNVKISQVKTSSCYITWMTDVDSNSYIDYGESTKYGKLADNSSLTKTHTLQLIELKPDTTYHFRVRSTSEDGAEAASKDYSIKTAKETEPAKVKKDASGQDLIWFWLAIGGLGILVLLLVFALIWFYLRHRHL